MSALGLLRERGLAAARPDVCGSVSSVTGMTAWVEGLEASVGDVVHLDLPAGPLPAELATQLREHRWDRQPTKWSQ